MAVNPIGALTNFITDGAYNDAKDSTKAGVNAYGNIDAPTAEELKVQLSELVNNGSMTPEQATAIMQDPSAMNGITLDPRLKQAQMDALTSLQDIGQNKGLTDMDRSQLAQIQGQEQTAARGAREAILQNANARGMGGSGIEMLSQMQNQQDAATRQSARDTSVAGMAQQRALQALQQAGTLGGNIEGQDFSQQAQVAAANDAINKFNTANKNTVGLANTAANNEAQKFNLAKELDVAKTNTDIKNQQAGYNAALPNTVFKNQIAQAGGVTDAGKSAAQTDIEKGKANTEIFGSAAKGTGTAVASDRNLKENIKDFDASAFLDSLTPSKYNYKEPEKFGEGKQVGVMAQDLEKHVPQMVEDTSEGKIVDYDKAGGPIFASLADLHQRIKNLEGR